MLKSVGDRCSAKCNEENRTDGLQAPAEGGDICIYKEKEGWRVYVDMGHTQSCG